MVPILSVDSLSKRYKNVSALNKLSFNVNKGEVLGILGPNGSGKTTLLSIILGVRKACSGTFNWFGENYTHNINKRIGALLEVPYFYPYLSVKRNMEITAINRNCTTDEIYQAIEQVELTEKLNHPVYTLSLGMKQRLAIAQTLVGNPPVLVFDEPTNGLDPEGIAFVRRLIRQQHENGKTIIIASHNLDEIQRVCTHVIILKNGQSIANGKVDELLKLKQIVQVETDKVEGLKAIVANNPNFKIIDSYSEGITISVADNEAIKLLNEQLTDKNIVPKLFEIRQPSLEEIFLDQVAK
ncbi:MAG: ABC transporter ATP-binding protein [Bacteroidales bacterium]|nr:ABC transporter ATP-binding protein [Bacteroidales bacterium]HRX30255.1 ABC transporter ATP-binding protein [Tenuifilaceae bacterium]